MIEASAGHQVSSGWRKAASQPVGSRNNRDKKASASEGDCKNKMERVLRTPLLVQATRIEAAGMKRNLSFSGSGAGCCWFLPLTRMGGGFVRQFLYGILRTTLILACVQGVTAIGRMTMDEAKEEVPTLSNEIDDVTRAENGCMGAADFPVAFLLVLHWFFSN